MNLQEWEQALALLEGMLKVLPERWKAEMGSVPPVFALPEFPTLRLVHNQTWWLSMLPLALVRIRVHLLGWELGNYMKL